MQQFPGITRPTFPRKATVTLLLLLVSVDLVFIVLHMLHVWTPWLPSRQFSIERDLGPAEFFQYLKMTCVAASLGLIFLRTRSWVFAGWGAFFGYLLLDDAFSLHERIGMKIGPLLGIPPAFGLRVDDYGELAVAAVLGLGAFFMVLVSLRRGSATARRVSQDFLVLLGLLAFFAVFFDALHTMTYFRAPTIAPLFALIEDGGEMIVVSCITAYGFDILNKAGRRRVTVWPWVRERLPAFARA